jgi:peptidoglycan hydrolase CwlO-like protein
MVTSVPEPKNPQELLDSLSGLLPKLQQLQAAVNTAAEKVSALEKENAELKAEIALLKGESP